MLNSQPMQTLKILLLVFFLLLGLYSVLKPAVAARATVKALKWILNLVGVEGDIVASPRAVSFLLWWNVLMLGVTLVTLLSIVAPSSFR